ncbi:SGNH/GDSL hydrolase family protein [Asticcacaulis sp. AC402]|uniref:SGNH/GDSL hydrolase family protein n=1 Tax=Asticcacaulis sp. AC402 TaxID=1282361 RepID=UPI0003C407F5|nr:SGNH/GDSL hydrolase family protein [Asticcacaulis sp. AC402]ESQ73601.1 hypothetical protein ABAC402_18430 [Asticcacaulis sp. AC402]
MSKSRKRIRAVVIGGSNTVMGLNPEKHLGYLWETVKACRKRGWKLLVTEDMSVGGTTIFNGLFQLKNSRELSKADVLIIEYALNDSSTYEKDRKLFQHWSRAYEGVIRYAREQNPKLQIISVIFESRTARADRRLNLIHAAIHRISEVYATRVADIARKHLETVGADQADNDLYYFDNHHVSNVVIAVAARDLCRELIKVKAKRRKKHKLPEPIDPHHFAHATAAGIDVITDAPRIDRRNSRFDVQAVELANKRMHFTLVDGKLLGLFYVCEASTGPAFLRCNDALYQVNLMKPGVSSGKFEFLVSSSGCEFLYAPDVNRPDDTGAYALSPIADGEVTKAVTPRSMMPHLVNPAPTLALYGLLYTGQLMEVRVEDANPQAAGLAATVA